MENRIAALEQTQKRHEAVIESLRDKLEMIHASLSRVEVRLNGRGEPGTSEFCKQHLGMLTGFCDRINKLDADMTRLDRDFTAMKIRIAAWVAVIVVLANFAAPIVLRRLGIV